MGAEHRVSYVFGRHLGGRIVTYLAHCEDEEPPVVVPLLVRIQPDVVEVALVAVQVEVQRVAVAVLVHEEMYAKPSMPLSIEYSFGLYRMRDRKSASFAHQGALFVRNCNSRARGS